MRDHEALAVSERAERIRKHKEHCRRVAAKMEPVSPKRDRTVKPQPDKSGVKSRRCLKCGINFRSEHPGIRVCDPCKDTPEWRNSMSVAPYEVKYR